MAPKASAYVKSVLHNGVGRYVCQLQRLTIKFCKTHGNSRGVREFIEKEMVDFARANPGVAVYLKPRRHRDPYVVAEYLNGERENLRVAKYSCDEMLKWTEHLRSRSGFPIVRLRKYWHTCTPSIQGFWTPFTHRPQFLGRLEDVRPSATEQLLQLAQQTGFQKEDVAPF